jgi:hypothetical protein
VALQAEQVILKAIVQLAATSILLSNVAFIPALGVIEN